MSNGEKYYPEVEDENWDDEESEEDNDEETERVDLEIARESWQRMHDLLCTDNLEIDLDTEELISQELANCLAYLADLKGTGKPASAESYKNELMAGALTTTFLDLIATRNELFDPEISRRDDYMEYTLRGIDHGLKFKFTKKTDREGKINIDYTTELIEPGPNFYRPAREELREKFAALV